jgi:hypothetical protein
MRMEFERGVPGEQWGEATRARYRRGDPMKGLMRYDAMCAAIDKAYAVDEVKDIRDKAMAFEAYSRQARNVDAERKACDIRIRAERKAGQLLKKMEKAKGVLKRGKNLPRGHRATTGPKTLEQMGISKRQSKNWQALADVPNETFELALAQEEKPTTRGIIAANKEPPKRLADPQALWLWGRLRDFERDGILDVDPRELFGRMTDTMRPDIVRLAPRVSAWLIKLTGDGP